MGSADASVWIPDSGYCISGWLWSPGITVSAFKAYVERIFEKDEVRMVNSMETCIDEAGLAREGSTLWKRIEDDWRDDRLLW